MPIKWREKSKEGFFASGALGGNFCWLKTFMDRKAFHAHWLEWIWRHSLRWDTFIGREGMKLRTGSLQCKQWSDFKSFCTVKKIGMGHFPLAVVGEGCCPWLSRRRASHGAPYTAGFCVLRGESLEHRHKVWPMRPDKPHTKSQL